MVTGNEPKPADVSGPSTSRFEHGDLRSGIGARRQEEQE